MKCGNIFLYSLFDANDNCFLTFGTHMTSYYSCYIPTFWNIYSTNKTNYFSIYIALPMTMSYIVIYLVTIVQQCIFCCHCRVAIIPCDHSVCICLAFVSDTIIGERILQSILRIRAYIHEARILYIYASLCYSKYLFLLGRESVCAYQNLTFFIEKNKLYYKFISNTIHKMS